MSCRTHQPFTDLLTRYHLQHLFYFPKWKTSFDPHLSRPRIFHQVTAICASKSFRVRSTRRLAMAATASGLTSGPWPGPAAGDRSMRSLRGATKCSFCVRRSCNLALAFPKLSRRFVKTLCLGGGRYERLVIPDFYDYSCNSTTLFFWGIYIHKWIINTNQ